MSGLSAITGLSGLGIGSALPSNGFLLESGSPSFLLLETGDYLLLE